MKAMQSMGFENKDLLSKAYDSKLKEKEQFIEEMFSAIDSLDRNKIVKLICDHGLFLLFGKSAAGETPLTHILQKVECLSLDKHISFGSLWVSRR